MYLMEIDVPLNRCEVQVQQTKLKLHVQENLQRMLSTSGSSFV